MNYIEVLEKIANDPLNWSEETREACRAGADAIRAQQKLDRLLRCWKEQEKMQGQHKMQEILQNDNR